MAKPPICNTKTYSHTDYGMPVSVHIGGDYRTNYKQSHGWIPTFPQDCDSRVPTKYSRLQDLNNGDGYLTNYRLQFPARACAKNPDQIPKPLECEKVKYVTTFEQRLFKDPPPPIVRNQSEAQSAYQFKQAIPERRIVYPPNPYKICEMRAFGRDEQPPIVPGKPGVMKHLDNYLSTGRADFVPYDEHQQRGIACKDIITFYDATGVPRGGKGYGPKNDTKIEALVKVKKPEQKPKKRSQRGATPMQNIPQRGFKTEYGENYQRQTKFAMEPYSELLAVSTFPSIVQSSPWQVLAAPSMYCTEYCHIGTGYPLNAAVCISPMKREIKHTLGCKCD